MRLHLILAVALAGASLIACGKGGSAPLQASPNTTKEQRAQKMKIRITIAGKPVTATLDDNETARDFASLLPLTLTLKDYADNEKISDLPKKLNTKGAPSSYDPSAGDITFYAPWGNLALFYKDGHDSPGLIKLGRFDTGTELLRQPGPLKVTFERIGD